MTIRADVLFRGAWYALEQCGRLLKGALVLHRNGELVSAVGLAMLAQEELGLHTFLMELWTKADQEGVNPTVKEVRQVSQDHLAKQRRGQRGVHIGGQPGDRISQLIDQILHNPPSSPEARAARDEIEVLAQQKARRQPAARADVRLKAFYVDINDSGTDWQRPADMSEGNADTMIRESVSAYMITWGNLRVADSADSRLRAALNAWPDHPELPVVEPPAI